MFLYFALLLTRIWSPRCIQVTFADESGEEQSAFLFPLNDLATRRDPALEEFLTELRGVVQTDSPGE